MRSTGFVILSLLLLASCGPPALETAVEDDQRAKSFAAPGPAQSALYIYRSSHYAWSWPVDVRVAGSMPTPLPVDTFVRVDLAPGPNVIHCIVNALPERRRVELLAAHIRYVEVSVDRGEWGPSCLVKEVSPEIGQAAVRGSGRIPALRR